MWQAVELVISEMHCPLATNLDQQTWSLRDRMGNREMSNSELSDLQGVNLIGIELADTQVYVPFFHVELPY